jgi:bifunctional non-homologous end joining protein LigD
VRPTPDARVSAPLTWAELPACELGDFTLATMPARYAKLGDLAAGMDEAAGSLETLLELAARHEAEGLGDAPWPPHYRKQRGEPPRVQPSKRRDAPLITVAKAARKEDALAGLARWRERHPQAATHLEEADVLVDSMRGRHTTWTRVRVNLRHVPVEQRPPAEAPDPDYDPWEKMRASS